MILPTEPELMLLPTRRQRRVRQAQVKYEFCLSGTAYYNEVNHFDCNRISDVFPPDSL